MTKEKDLADRAREGTFPVDPAAESARVRPLRAVKPGERSPAAEAERALLGSILWAGLYEPVTDRAKAVEAIVEARMFQSPQHGAAFSAMLALEGSGGVTEPVAVASEARRAGGAVESSYLTALSEEATAPSTPKLVGWAKTIREGWLCRQAAEFGRLTAASVAAGQLSSAEVIADARARLEELAGHVAGTSTTVSAKDAARQFIATASKRPTAYPTCFRDLDEAIVGLFPRETSVLAARTSVGKSALAAKIARNVVERVPGTACLYASLEMAAQPFTARLIADDAGIPAKKLRRGALDPDEWARFVASAHAISKLKIEFLTSTMQTLASIAAAARAFSAGLALNGERLALIVIDHVGLVKPSAEILKKANREQQVAETSRGLRYLAERFDCHVMALAQIGREAEKEGSGKMPKLHQLRESDSLAQDADMTLILHRERDAKTGILRNDKPAALAVAKARHDEAAIMLLGFEPRYVRFGDHNEATTYGDWYGGKS